MSDFASAFPSVPTAGYASVPDSPASTHTAFAWGLALYPVVQVVIIVVITFVVKSFGGDVPSIGVLGSSVAVSLYCGYNDAKVLRDRGFRPPGWGWALIPLVYFIIRAVRVGRGSLGPLLVWVAIQAVFTVIIVMSVLIPLYLSVRGDQPLTTTERAALLTPAGMAEAVAADLRRTTTTSRASCARSSKRRWPVHRSPAKPKHRPAPCTSSSKPRRATPTAPTLSAKDGS
jgi:hypothetical protein